MNNEILTILYDNLYALLLEEIRETIRIHGLEIVDTIRQHQQIYTLIKNGDAEGATRTMIQHLESSMWFLKKVLESRESKISTEQ